MLGSIRGIARMYYQSAILQVGELTTISTMYEDTIQSAGKEKAALSAQLEESKKQLMTANEDLGKMRAEIDHEVRSALKGIQICDGTEMLIQVWPKYTGMWIYMVTKQCRLQRCWRWTENNKNQITRRIIKDAAGEGAIRARSGRPTTTT